MGWTGNGRVTQVGIRPRVAQKEGGGGKEEYPPDQAIPSYTL